MMRTLDEVLTYEVDQIRIVKPHETEELVIQQGEDYCTLVTCTPYGVNTHRLLVRGRRIPNGEEARVIRVMSDAVRIEPLIVAPVIMVLILIFILLVLFFKRSRRPQEDEELDEEDEDEKEKEQLPK